MKIIMGICLALNASLALALDVVATTSSMGMLAREIGGPAVKVVELVAPERDAHSLQVKPSMMRALRDADLLLAVGADLEIGWLPVAVGGAGNAKVQQGQPGYFEAAAQVSLLEAGQAADRSKGDVHPAGNPHVNLDPERMAKIAAALAERLALLDPAQAAAYRQRAAVFRAALAERLPGWRGKAAGAPGAVLYHKDASYLMHFVGVPVLGYLEPLPGIPPTAAHLQALIGKLQGKRGVIIHAPYQPASGAERVAQATGWSLASLPLEPKSPASAAAYFQLIDRWIDVLVASRQAP
ncbi:metal ABC transporter solute-binding protein, Zn/Mn family [Azonexus sp.]|uniref:metal ABC transporter substrate-binding protein n=1 Tax=Azonexus sp. TaxID=1872668 RepID=UPI0027B87D62|nr:zinc ABC transporter substrate-binding protein [Azonexus sp.]